MDYKIYVNSIGFYDDNIKKVKALLFIFFHLSLCVCFRWSFFMRPILPINFSMAFNMVENIKIDWIELAYTRKNRQSIYYYTHCYSIIKVVTLQLYFNTSIYFTITRHTSYGCKIYKYFWNGGALSSHYILFNFIAFSFRIYFSKVNYMNDFLNRGRRPRIELNFFQM